MSAIDDLVPHLKKLRLSGALQSLEVERRDGKQLEQRVRRANFEHAKARGSAWPSCTAQHRATELALGADFNWWIRFADPWWIRKGDR
jgi:hypothetical protein